MDYWSYIPDYIQAVSVAVAAGFTVWGVNSWRRETIGKRKTEVSEQAIVAASRVQSALEYVRNPFGHMGEGSSRERNDDESVEISKELDQAFVPIERLNKFKEEFSQLISARNLCRAYFGENSIKPFNELLEVRSEIFNSARIMSLQASGHTKLENKSYAECKKVIWRLGEDDEISKKINKAVLEVERLCAEYLRL